MAKSNYITVFIPSDRRDEFEELVKEVTTKTNRNRNQVLREVIFKCLGKLVKSKDYRKSISIQLNL